MKPYFKTQLVARLINHRNGGRWLLEMPLVFESVIAGTIIVPSGFETDFASVPRIIFAYLLTGNTAHAAAVVHDYLYQMRDWPITRKGADDVMLEAMVATGIPWWRRQLIYAGVKVGGGGGFRRRTT